MVGRDPKGGVGGKGLGIGGKGAHLSSLCSPASSPCFLPLLPLLLPLPSHLHLALPPSLSLLPRIPPCPTSPPPHLPSSPPALLPSPPYLGSVLRTRRPLRIRHPQLRLHHQLRRKPARLLREHLLRPDLHQLVRRLLEYSPERLRGVQHVVSMHLRSRATATTRAAPRASVAPSAADASTCAASSASNLSWLGERWILHNADERNV